LEVHRHKTCPYPTSGKCGRKIIYSIG